MSQTYVELSESVDFNSLVTCNLGIRHSYSSVSNMYLDKFRDAYERLFNLDFEIMIALRDNFDW